MLRPNVWQDIVSLAERVSADHDGSAITSLANALQNANDDERQEYRESGLGENVYMGWTTRGDARALRLIDLALAAVS